MAVYTHVVHDTRREAISRMDRLLRRGPPTARVVTAAKGPGPRSARGLLAGAPAGFEPATPASGARGGDHLPDLWHPALDSVGGASACEPRSHYPTGVLR